ncbi:hypothetical protein [Nonomuraea ceibae]|uniref:hypothetical protein n=1 Tax=Nonomuraea ceibae TaxID=1935170 RepID=UPI001C5F2A90|nr:hypothetical protein [Nonomuraea ceibae]
MTIDHQISPWFTKSTASPAQERVIQRICSQIAPAGTTVNVSDLPLGGVQIWTDGDAGTWSLYQRMARELRLAGWHAEAGTDRLMVLGWSAEALSYRVLVLDAALAGRLADYDLTSFMAVTVATRLLQEGLAAERVVPEVEARLREELRWPGRLADLAGLERTATLEPLRHRLAQIAGLEARVRDRCAEHLSLAGRVATSVTGGKPPPRIGFPRLTAGLATGLSERLVAASVPNQATAPPHALLSPSDAGALT